MSDSKTSTTETPTENIIVIGVVSLIISLLVIFGNDAHPLAIIIYFWGFFIIGLLVGTKKGRRHMKDIWEEAQKQNKQQQQQQVGGNSEPTKICSECGWKNPKSNNYCHDCGSKLNE